MFRLSYRNWRVIRILFNEHAPSIKLVNLNIARKGLQSRYTAAGKRNPGTSFVLSHSGKSKLYLVINPEQTKFRNLLLMTWKLEREELSSDAHCYGCHTYFIYVFIPSIKACKTAHIYTSMSDRLTMTSSQESSSSSLYVRPENEPEFSIFFGSRKSAWENIIIPLMLIA